MRNPEANPEANRFYGVCDEIRQRAFDGKLPIWAMRRHCSLYEPVPWEFWRNRTIQPGYMILPDVQDVWVEFTHALEVGQVPHARDSEWHSFMTNKDAVEKLWPAKNDKG